MARGGPRARAASRCRRASARTWSISGRSPPVARTCGRGSASSRAATSAAAPASSSVCFSRRRANRCCDHPPAAVRPWTYRRPTLLATTRPSSSTAQAYPPRLTSRTPTRRGARTAAANATTSGPFPQGCANDAVAPSVAARVTPSPEADVATAPWRSSKPAAQRSSRAAATWTVRLVVSGRTTQTSERSDIEPEGAQLLTALFGDLVGAPRRHPHPVDADAVDEAVERLRGLVLDDVGQRAGRGRQRHVDDGLVVLVDGEAVDEAEVDDVDPELGVDDVAQGLLDVGRVRDAGLAHGVSSLVPPPVVARASALVNASSNAVHPSIAHFTRLACRPTPANATPSPRTASSGSTEPRDRTMVRNSSTILLAASGCWPTARSCSTDVAAWLIEQPSPSQATSRTVPPACSTATRSVTSSPQSGLTCRLCAHTRPATTTAGRSGVSAGPRRPPPCFSR